MATSKTNPEEIVYRAVQARELEIRSDGSIWRLGARRANRWAGGATFIPCTPRRAEHTAREYQQVRVMFGGVRYCSMAHRLVWLHFMGPIPLGMTVNHRNGNKTDNHPLNLELATESEQQMHARLVLRRGRLNQYGTLNTQAKLTREQVEEICARRASGEKLRSIATDLGVALQTVSRIARGERRSLG